MLDINVFRIERGGNPDLVRKSQLARGADVKIVDEILELDKKYLSALHEYEQINKEINQIKKEIGIKIKQKEDYTELVNKKKEIEKKLELSEMETINIELKHKLSLVGNIVHDSVVMSSDEKFNQIMKTYGCPKILNFKLVAYR